jgi:hypothetical protein
MIGKYMIDRTRDKNLKREYYKKNWKKASENIRKIVKKFVFF